MRKLSIDEIKSSFIVDDLEHWVDPEISNKKWDDCDFIAWKHPKAGHYFLCVESENDLFGVVVQMNSGAGNVGANCDFCFARNENLGVKAAFIDTVDNPRRKIGIHCCGDLKCSERVRGLSQATFMYETITTGRRIERLQEKVSRFTRKIFAGRAAS